MKAYKRYSTVRQMAGSVAMFAALALLLESGGLYQWAQRLDLGPERTVAVPLVTVLHRGLGWMPLERWRRDELAKLARAGWSDDPEALAEERVSKPGALGGALYGGQTPGPSDSVAASTVDDAPAVKAVPPTAMLPLKPMAGDPPLLSVLPPIPSVAPGRTRTVVLTGDSMMAVGLSSAILRESAKYKDLTIVRSFKSGTGLARPEVYDWRTEYPAMLGDTKPDVVVVAIGANDGQGFVEGGVTYPFGTAEWKAIYQRRVQEFLEILEADGAKVVWVGLPPMKSDAYSERIALVNRIDYAVVKSSPQAIWFSSAGLVGDASGHFQDFGQVRGATARLRQPDGIHLSDDGAVLLTAKLLPWLAKQEAATPEIQPESKETASAESKP